ncbi:MAG: DUF72 domain-containing protein [Firmicutes bacterium]|nr:DUF72 domain-containing protein [Bacillota bacterium]NPV30302.1 DUF72 domain-containing protein [Bacillota bacterium]
MADLRVGTSGYNYPHWRGAFYPKEIPGRRWLNFYAAHFNTVELNVTFYRLPLAKTFASWYDSTPPDFRFAVKGSRMITHIKRLRDVAEPLAAFFGRAEKLQEKLAVVLWQLPPGLRGDPGLLAEFCRLVQGNDTARAARHAFEFRHNSWFSPEVYEILHQNNFGLCIADSPRWPQTLEVTADFVYLRFHGSEKVYTSCYTKEELERWAKRIREWLESGRDVYAYFNNDAGGWAVANARDLISLTRARQEA